MAPLGLLARAIGKQKRKAGGGTREKAQKMNYIGKLYELTAKKHKSLNPVFRYYTATYQFFKKPFKFMISGI